MEARAREEKNQSAHKAHGAHEKLFSLRSTFIWKEKGQLKIEGRVFAHSSFDARDFGIVPLVICWVYRCIVQTAFVIGGTMGKKSSAHKAHGAHEKLFSLRSTFIWKEKGQLKIQACPFENVEARAREERKPECP